MSRLKLNLIAAACENMGIGINGDLPWKLKKEMAYFSSKTSTVKDPSKINAVIMGRKSWDCIPDKYRPLPRRLNIVLSRQAEKFQEKVPTGVIVVQSLDDAVSFVEGREDIEAAWVIGGASIYKLAMEHPACDKIYLTEIQKAYQCDTYFPPLGDQFKLISLDGVPQEKQVEGDVSYYYRVYQKELL